jgi:hypothetical protein
MEMSGMLDRKEFLRTRGFHCQKNLESGHHLGENSCSLGGFGLCQGMSIRLYRLTIIQPI